MLPHIPKGKWELVDCLLLPPRVEITQAIEYRDSGVPVRLSLVAHTNDQLDNISFFHSSQFPTPDPCDAFKKSTTVDL